MEGMGTKSSRSTKIVVPISTDPTAQPTSDPSATVDMPEPSLPAEMSEAAAEADPPEDELRRVS
jgi:hypothetical protein